MIRGTAAFALAVWSLAASQVADLHLILDRNTRRGEITFTGGRRKGGDVEYRRWRAQRLERYIEGAVARGILAADWKERLGPLAGKKPYKGGLETATRLAFLMTTRDFLDQRIQELVPHVSESGRPKDEGEVSRHQAAKRLVKKELTGAISECRRRAASMEINILVCPKEPPRPER